MECDFSWLLILPRGFTTTRVLYCSCTSWAYNPSKLTVMELFCVEQQYSLFRHYLSRSLVCFCSTSAWLHCWKRPKQQLNPDTCRTQNIKPAVWSQTQESRQTPNPQDPTGATTALFTFLASRVATFRTNFSFYRITRAAHLFNISFT